MSSDGKPRRYRKASLSDSEIMTILIVFYFGSFRNFKYCYLFFIRQHMKASFSNAVSYNRVVELKNRVFFQMTFFLNLSAFGYWRHTASLIPQQSKTRALGEIKAAILSRYVHAPPE